MNGSGSAVTRVLIVDDEAITRRGLRLIIESGAEGMAVVGEAADGHEAVRLAEELEPTVVMLDIRMPGRDGLSATSPIVATGARVLILTTYDTDANLYRAFREGASGFILKTAHPDDLIHAVRVVTRGESLLAPGISRRLIETYVRPRPAAPPWLARLTEREREVLTEIARGRSNAEIAALLYLGESTIKSHVANILDKLRVRDRLQAVVLAYESGYVRPEDPT